ncbi:MAG: hypothetical protein ABI466_07205 [Chloroflexota bacterium]
MVPDLSEIFEVAGDLTLVPGEQDRLDIGKYLYSFARPMPVSSVICDIVAASSPCFGRIRSSLRQMT